MSTLEIITAPDPVLATMANPVARVDDALRKQLDAMLETMYESNGIGLAANQVGLLSRVLVMDLDWRGEDGERQQGNPHFIINPEIIWESEEISMMEEGCLSVPGHYAEVQRPADVRVKYLDYNGKEAELAASGLLSHCVQHEIDHLNGMLFVDHISRLKRNMIIKRLEKAKKSQSIL
ncbi:MAG: peptide deformylase [Rhodospirillales bacterium]|nr:peptide deformylase [Rhodospirillales bacterium]